MSDAKGARLELRKVTAGYGPVTVLRDVTIVVPSGSVVALLGPNGAGKTTLLRVASGLLKTNEGALLLDDHDRTRANTAVLAETGVCHVPEGRGIFRRLSVRENLRLQSPVGVPTKNTEELAVEAFPVLGERLSQTAGTLSGGQQQMLALARAYVANPRIVLLDEVSMGLAPIIVDEIFEFLAKLAGRGVSLLIVEQYVKRALALATYAYVLNKGRLTFAGEAAELRGSEIMSQYLGGGQTPQLTVPTAR